LGRGVPENIGDVTMSAAGNAAAYMQGADWVMGLAPALNDAVRHLNQEERAKWWESFIATLIECMEHDIGYEQCAMVLERVFTLDPGKEQTN
jgi:hypothetical protein